MPRLRIHVLRFVAPYLVAAAAACSSGSSGSGGSGGTTTSRGPVPGWHCYTTMNGGCGCDYNKGAPGDIACPDLPCCWLNNFGQPTCDCYADQGAACMAHQKDECGDLTAPTCQLVPACPTGP